MNDELKNAIDALLLGLAEMGIYESGTEISPDGRHYDSVAVAAYALDNIVNPVKDESGFATCDRCGKTGGTLHIEDSEQLCNNCYANQE